MCAHFAPCKHAAELSDETRISHACSPFATNLHATLLMQNTNIGLLLPAAKPGMSSHLPFARCNVTVLFGQIISGWCSVSQSIPSTTELVKLFTTWQVTKCIKFALKCNGTSHVNFVVTWVPFASVTAKPKQCNNGNLHCAATFASIKLCVAPLSTKHVSY